MCQNYCPSHLKSTRIHNQRRQTSTWQAFLIKSGVHFHHYSTQGLLLKKHFCTTNKTSRHTVLGTHYWQFDTIISLNYKSEVFLVYWRMKYWFLKSLKYTIIEAIQHAKFYETLMMIIIWSFDVSNEQHTTL